MRCLLEGRHLLEGAPYFNVNTQGKLEEIRYTPIHSLIHSLVIRQNSREPIFWEVMDSFVLVAHSSLAASRSLLQRFLASLNFTLDSGNLFCWYKQKK